MHNVFLHIYMSITMSISVLLPHHHLVCHVHPGVDFTEFQLLVRQGMQAVEASQDRFGASPTDIMKTTLGVHRAVTIGNDHEHASPPEDDAQLLVPVGVSELPVTVESYETSHGVRRVTQDVDAVHRLDARQQWRSSRQSA